MNDLVNFLTTKEIMVVYIVIITTIIFSIFYYFINRSDWLKKKHNTRELNKLVKKVQEKTNTVDEEVKYPEPILQNVINTSNDSNVVTVSDNLEKKELDSPVLIEKVDVVQDNPKEELQYTTIEPDQVTAQLELKKLTEELRRQQEEEEKESIITNYEESQEENAIISLEELVKKSKDMYEANEVTQYADEGNEPISLQELENRVGVNTKSYTEPFIIENVVSDEDIKEVEKEVEESRVVVKLDDFNTVKVENVESDNTKTFKSSPIISPVFGIEKEDTSLELENTANYDKLDQEIKRTNEFLMTLKELQQKLD